MSGPALKKQHSHKSIHDGAYAEARDLTEIVEQLFEEERKEECSKAADMLVEFWETRVIAHADSEEEEETGLYNEMIREQPELERDIIMLKRDHDILRIIVARLREDLKESDVEKKHLNEFNALLVVNQIHSRSEEEILPEH